MRKFRSAVLMLSLLVLLVAGTALADTVVKASVTETRAEGSFLWQVERDDEGWLTLHLSGTGKMVDYEAPSVFCEADRHPGYWTLSDYRQISRLIIDPGVTYIGQNAFRGAVGSYSGTTAKHGSVMLSGTVTIPNTVTGIGNNAFDENNSLKYIEVPDSVTVIGTRAFHASTTIVGSYAYQYAVSNGYNYKLTSLGTPELSATISDETVTLTWTELPYSNVTYYVIRLYENGNNAGKVYEGAELTCTDVISETGKTFGYYAFARVSSNQSENSTTVWVTRKLASPKISAVSLAETGRTKIKWSEISGAVSYDVYRSTTKTGTYTRIKKGVTNLYYTDTTAKAGKTYYYKVRAVAGNTAANSALSTSVMRTRDLARPKVTLTLTSAKKIKLTWGKVTAAVSYDVYRCTTKTGTYTRIKKGITKLTYTDTTVKTGKTYYYKVKAIAEKSGANSAFSTVKYKKVK